MKRNLFLLPAILFLSTGLFAQNHLFWYPDTCLKSDLNAVLDHTVDGPPMSIDVSFEKIVFAGDSLHCTVSSVYTSEKRDSETQLSAGYALDSLGRLLLTFDKRHILFTFLHDNQNDVRNPILFYADPHQRTIVIEQRGTCNVRRLRIDSLTLQTEYINMTGPYTQQTWRYIPGDSIRYAKCVRDMGGKGCGIEYREKAFAPVHWESFVQQLIDGNVVAIAGSHRTSIVNHATFKRIVLWSGGQALALRYHNREFPQFDYLYRSE